MKELFAKLTLGVATAGTLSVMGYATHQVFIVIPRVEARTEKIEPMDAKLDKLLEDVSFIKGKMQ